MSKKLIRTVVVLCLMISMFSVCFASEKSFNTRHVDSNSWTFVISEVKSASGSEADLKIRNILNSNLGSCNYSGVQARAETTGTVKVAYLNRWCTLEVPSAHRNKGCAVSLYCKGRNSSLDCYISGLWNVH